MSRAVKYYSLLEPSGYGLAALAYIESLLGMGVHVYWTPLVNSQQGYIPWTWMENAQQQVTVLIGSLVDNPDLASTLVQSLKPVDSYQCIVMHTVPEYWPRLIEPDGYHIGYTVWETSVLPKHFPGIINQMDKVLVPTEFNRTVFEQSGVVIPIEVVPHILNLNHGLPVMQEAGKAVSDKERYVFYSINVWAARKAMWTLVHCYLKAFTGDDAVELRLKTSLTGPKHEQDTQTHRTERLVEEIREQYSNPAKIHMICENITEREIAILHSEGDCYVSTTHSEGWGLGAFEAAGYGNPVIMTGWGGQLDFLPNELAYLIRYRLVNVEDKLGFDSYSPDQHWAEVDEEHTIELMQHVYQHQAIAKKRAQRLAPDLANRFNADVIGTTLHNAIFS